MKYLKTFESTNIVRDTDGDFNIMPLLGNINLPIHVIEELRDICLELEDDGFLVDISKSPESMMFPQGFTYIIITYPQIHKFTYTKEISEVIERIKEYTLSQGYNLRVRGHMKDPGNILPIVLHLPIKNLIYK